MVINKKVIRNMKAHKSTFIVASALLFLSTFLFTMFWTGTIQIKDTISNFKKDYNVEDVYFTTAIRIEDKVKLEKDFNITLEKIEWKDFKVLGDVTLRVYKDRNTINKKQIVDGENLQNPLNLVVNKDFYTLNKKSYGDKIKLNNLEFNLVGEATSPDNLYMLENDTSMFSNKDTFAVGFVSSEDFSKLGNSSSGYSVKFNEENKDEFKEYIKKNYMLLSYEEAENNSKINAIDSDLDGMFMLGQYIPIVVIVMVSVLIAIVLWRLIRGELTELGTLYALGYKKNKLVKHYMIYPLSVTLIGSLLSQIPAVLMTPFLSSMLEVEYSLPIINITINPVVIFASVLIPILIIIPINYFTINRVLKHSAVNLMKGKIKEDGPTFMEKKIKLKGLSFENRFKIKDMSRNLSRTILTLITISFSSILLFLVFVMVGAFDNIIEKGYKESYEFKNQYILSKIKTEEVNGEKLWTVPVKAKAKNSEEILFTLEAREKTSKLMKLFDKEDNQLSFTDNIITDVLAKKLGVKIGDEITILSDIDDSKITVKIDKIAKSYLGDTIYIPLDMLYEKTNIPKGSYIAVQSQNDLKFDDGEIASTTSKDAIIRGLEGMMLPLKACMILIGVIAGLIGMAMIYVITSMVIDENRINISMFKIMGYQKDKLTKIILNTNDILVIIGFILSIPLTKVLLDKLFEELTKNIDFSLDVQITISSIIIVFGILMSIYWISKVTSRKKVLNISMEEALKSGRE